MTRPHSTHHDDCGCLSERHAQQIADANAAIKRLTRERDEAVARWNATAGASQRDLDDALVEQRRYSFALAASQAECAALREAGATIIRTKSCISGEDEARLIAALSRAPGGSEALRAWTERAARLAVECFERNECDFVCMGGNCLSTDPERVKACMANDREAFFAAIVARLVPDAGQKGAEG